MVRFLLTPGWVLVVFAFAYQSSTSARPASSRVSKSPAPTQGARPLETIARVTLPPVDVAAVRLEDQERERNGLPPRYAIPNPVRIKPDSDGTWENLGNGMLMWRLRIHSPGAESINLGFSRYHMPPGGRLLVYASDFSHAIRPLTERDNETHGQLWTPVVRSDGVVVELTIPRSALPTLQLQLSSINVGYRGFGTPTTAMSGSCNVDVVCPEGDDWRDQIQSVGVISLGGSTFCTGFGVNNTAQDLTPYFMTAAHCGIRTGNAASLVVYWNYQNSWCRTPGSPSSGDPGDGTLDQYQTGSYHRASYSPSDATLVELDDDPDPEWNVVFAGWDRSDSDATSAVCIHHPNTDEKRISFEYDPTTTTAYLGQSVPGDGTHVRVTDWDLGTTEPGSSGSPLFNQEKRIVGQLHGGYASCTSQTSDWYGRLSVSWTGGGSSATSLSDWLDPGHTGEMFIDHISSAGLMVTPGGDVEHLGDVGGPFTNPTTTYTLANPTPDPLDYRVSLTTSFGILLDGGTDPVTGRLAGNGGATEVIVTLGPDIDALVLGVYIEEVAFDDLTNGVSHVRRHVVEVGQRAQRPAAAEDWNSATMNLIGSATCVPGQCPATSTCIDNICYFAYNRYLHVYPRNVGQAVALRVKHVDSGATRWVESDIQQVVHNNSDPAVLRYAFTAPDGSAPDHVVWPDEPFAVTGGFIIPGEQYEVQAIAVGWDSSVEANYSSPLSLATAIFGDAVSTLTPPGPDAFAYPPQGPLVDVTDMTAVVAGFTNTNWTSKLYCDLVGEADDPSNNNVVVDVSDMTAVVDAFGGGAYPGVAPDQCP